MNLNRANKFTVFFVLAILLIIVLTFLSKKHRSTVTSATAKISVVELHADVDYLLNIINKNNPRPYDECSKVTIDSLAKAIKQSIDKPINSITFYRKIRPLVSAFNDAHLSIFHPELFESAKANTGLFPYQIIIDHERIFIKKDLTNGSATFKGREIESINGIKTETILKTLPGFVSGPTIFYKKAVIEDSFQRLFWRAYGDYNIYSISFKNDLPITHKGVLMKTLDSIHGEGQPFTYTKLSGKSIGVLKIASLEYDGKATFDNFLKGVFSLIKKEPVKSLVIDIRNNPGGSTLLARNLFNYITTKPYAVSWQETSFENGKTKNVVDTSLSVPQKNADKFSGKVFLLINALTGSSAHMMATTFKYYKLGTLVGCSGFTSEISGEVNKFELPNSKLILYCPTTAFILPHHSTITATLTPDYLIKESLPDKLSDKDAFMDYCRSVADKDK